jgi:hypothetical protein
LRLFNAKSRTRVRQHVGDKPRSTHLFLSPSAKRTNSEGMRVALMFR